MLLDELERSGGSAAQFAAYVGIEKTAASRRRNWGRWTRGACRSAEDVGLQLAAAKSILGRLQGV